MYWEDDEFLHERMKRLGGNVPAPRTEEIKRLQGVLSKQAREMDRRSKMGRTASWTLQTAAFFALAVWGTSLAFPSVKQELPGNSEQAKPSYETVNPPSAQKTSPLGREKDGKAAQEKEQQAKPAKQKATEQKAAETRTETRKQTAPPTSQTVAPAEPYAATADGSATKKAAAYLEQLIGAEQRQYKLVESLADPKQNQHVFVRQVNGLPFLNEHYTVGLDENNNGKAIAAKQIQGGKWSEQLFPDPAAAIGKAEAETILVQALTPYFAETQTSGYDPALMGFLDANSGQLIGIDKAHDSLRGKTYKLDAGRTSWKVTTEDEAVQLVASEFGLTVEKTFWRAENDFLDTRNYRWRLENGGSIALKTVSSTGEVVELEYKSLPAASDRTTAPKDAAAATQTAASFLQHYLASKVTGLQVMEVEQDKLAYRIYFQALSKANEAAALPVYTVTVQAATGQVVGFRKTLPKQEQAAHKPNRQASAAEAAKQYVERHPLQLAYVWIKGETAPSLVYVPLERDMLSDYIEE